MCVWDKTTNPIEIPCHCFSACPCLIFTGLAYGNVWADVQSKPHHPHPRIQHIFFPPLQLRSVKGQTVSVVMVVWTWRVGGGGDSSMREVASFGWKKDTASFFTSCIAYVCLCILCKRLWDWLLICLCLLTQRDRPWLRTQRCTGGRGPGLGETCVFKVHTGLIMLI